MATGRARLHLGDGGLGTDATSLADFGISGYRVRRFDFHAAPRRIELDDALREKLTLS